MLTRFSFIDKGLIEDFIEDVKRSLFKRTLLILLFCAALLAPGQSFADSDDYHTFGIFGGLSFPKGLLGKLDLNISHHWGLDYEASVSLFWTIQQADVLYFFNRSEWSAYVGAGIQSWSFYGFSGSTDYNGILFGTGNTATTATLSLGLVYVAKSGFAVDLNIAGDEFVNAPLDLKSRVVPEGNFSLGFFF